MLDNPEDNLFGGDDDSEDQENFQSHFINGCNAFVFIASQIKGDNRPSDEIVMAIIKEIIGNRDTKTVKFQDILERLYNRIVEYCTDSLDIISIMDAMEQETDYQEYKDSIRVYRKRKKISSKKVSTKKKVKVKAKTPRKGKK